MGNCQCFYLVATGLYSSLAVFIFASVSEAT